MPGESTKRGCIELTQSTWEIPEADWSQGGLPPRKAAEFTGESQRTIYDAMKRGELRWASFGVGRRIPKLDLIRRLDRKAREGRQTNEGPGRDTEALNIRKDVLDDESYRN